ncbi:MAG: hypothetical protein Ct9H90mP25_1240 [Gammaproteobacteria bacterium]|nr:MAG: hypothetical protein Ct9H90mP25_1240 [Gammaproteobacteria bacterium]
MSSTICKGKSVKVLLNLMKKERSWLWSVGVGEVQTRKMLRMACAFRGRVWQELMKLEAKARDDELNKNED